MATLAELARKIGLASRNKDLRFVAKFYDDVEDTDEGKRELTKMAQAVINDVGDEIYRGHLTESNGFKIGQWYGSVGYVCQITGFNRGGNPIVYWYALGQLHDQIKKGEPPRIHTVGEPALSDFKKYKLLEKRPF